MTQIPPLNRAVLRKGSRRSPGKHQAILEAATDVFLRCGYLGTSMDEVAALSGVSKQTVYQHFAKKEALFIEIVTTMTDQTGDAVLRAVPVLADEDDVGAYLRSYAYQQLIHVLTPRVMQLRRLVIGEVSRFPALGRVLNDHGPRRSISALATTFEQLQDQGLLAMDDPLEAAAQFNWLIMSGPLNQAMLLGDGAIPKAPALRRHAAEGVRVFMAAYGTGTKSRRTRSKGR